MPRHDVFTTTDFQERYDVLLDIGRVLTSTLEPDQLYRTIYEQASRVLETTGFYISLYEESTDEARIVFYADRGVVERPGTSYRGSESRAIRERRPVLEDVGPPDRAILLLGPDSDEEVTQSVIAAPMVHESQVLGVISAQSYRYNEYSGADLELLTAIADLAAVAVWNARTVKELERQRREMEQLEQVSRALTSSLELREVLHRIVEATRELAEADGAGVWLMREDQAELMVTSGGLALPTGTRLDVPPALQARFLDGRKPLLVDRNSPSQPLPGGLLELLQADSAVAVPLIVDEELIGALSISHLEGRRYPPELVRLLQRLAAHASVAVANARLHERLRTASLTDPLTLLPNRRHMDIFLEKEFAAAERGRSLAVVLFDLNDFKKFNDTRGHQAGDEILRQFGEILTRETRAMNLAARYGGDEFVCILSDTDEQGGARHVGRVMRAVAADPLMGSVGVSAGVATYEPGMREPSALIRRADEALYRAKRERGRELR